MTYIISYHSEKAKQEKDMNCHRCPQMLNREINQDGPRRHYIYRNSNKDGVWYLYENDYILRNLDDHCEFCGFVFPKNRNTTTLISREVLHRCSNMIVVETRRNKEKANTPGNRFYVIQWDSHDGWSLFNRGEKTTKHKKLEECPFCRTKLKFYNQVVIE